MLFSEQKPQCRRAARRLIGPRLLGRKVARRAPGLTGVASVGPIHSYKVEKVWNVLPLRDAITNVQQCATLRSKLWKSAVANVYSTLHIERSNTRA